MAQNAAKNSASTGGPAAYLFVDDDDRIVRFRLGQQRVTIGRDQGNDIWIEHPDVPKHALVVVRRDGHDVMKVYEGALVRLNDVGVTGMHRLYSGDRITVADREFQYGRDDAPPDFAVALTIDTGQAPAWAAVLRQTRARVGRRDADVVINDPSVGERHLRVEAYADDMLFVCDLGAAMGTTLDGARVDGRARLQDGARLGIGRVQIAVHVLDADAHGLLDVPDAPRARPRQVDTPIGARSYDIDAAAQAQAKNARAAAPPSPPPRPSADPQAPPPTVIGSLAQLAAARNDGPKRTKKRPRPASHRSDSWRPPTAPADRPAPRTPTPPQTPPRKRRKTPKPSVKVSPELYERGRKGGNVVDGPTPSRHEPQRRYGAGRTSGPQERAEPPAARGKSRKQILHEKLTDVLDSNNVRDLVGERYVAAYQNVEPSHPDRDRRYRPSQPGGARLLTDQKLVPRESAPPPLDPFGVHAQVTRAGDYRQVDNVQLTNMLDVLSDKPRLSRDRHQLDPDAMPQQLRDAEAAEARRNRRGPIDSARRRSGRPPIDDSRRIEPDED